ncbi:MAG: peptidoglycan editing factor PgeF [Neisseriaceae bacterium]|nr:peptidoglycan editing factor PgeF [Neisseriaceae bacterium]
MTENDFFTAHWHAPDNVKTLLTYRTGGVSVGAFRSLNVGLHVNDDEKAVLENRRLVQEKVGKPMVYLNQTHGTNIVLAHDYIQTQTPPDADASIETTNRAACVIMTADCLPVLLCDTDGTTVAAVHCGWRSLAANILPKTVAKMGGLPETKFGVSQNILAFCGACIGKTAFEVGGEVKAAFAHILGYENAFIPLSNNKFLCDLHLLAELSLNAVGVKKITHSPHCTYNEPDKFFSYRREYTTGRMLSAIWLA